MSAQIKITPFKKVLIANRGDTHFFKRANNTQGNFAAVGDKNFFERSNFDLRGHD